MDYYLASSGGVVEMGGGKGREGTDDRGAAASRGHEVTVTGAATAPELQLD